MRLFRAAISAAIAACVLLVPAAASAQIDQISFGEPQLQSGIAAGTVVVRLTVQCEPGWNLAIGFVNLTQTSGHKQAIGSGDFSEEFPGVPCSGAGRSVTVTVSSFTGFTFKQGRAAISAEVFVFNPVTGELISESAGPEATRLRK